MLFELQATEYQFKNQRLIVLPADGEPIALPKPKFTLIDTAFVIKNWTLEQLTAFFSATEFTEQWYETPQDKRELCTIRLEDRLVQMKARPKEPSKAGRKKAIALLQPSLIIHLFRANKPLKPAVLSSLEHYAKNGQLTAGLCESLSPVIQNDKDGVIPELVKTAVAARLAQIEATALPQQRSTASIPTPWTPVSDSHIQGPQATFATVMRALDHFHVIGDSELELLEPYRNQMNCVQLSMVISKMSFAVGLEKRNEWSKACQNMRRDPLGLAELLEPDLDLLATESELNNTTDWLEALLQ